MSLAAVRADVAVIDELLRDIAPAPVLAQGSAPAEQAGVTTEAAAALEALLDAYEMGGLLVREAVRGIFRAYPSFRWGVHLSGDWESATEFRRRLLHVSAVDQGADPRDELMTIWALCNRARERGIDVAPKGLLR